MKIFNEELLAIAELEAKRLDTWTANRAKRHGIKRPNISRTIVNPGQSTINITVMASPSIRYRDAGFGRFYNKGQRQSTVRVGTTVKRRKRANIINRPMFSMLHRLSELGLINLTQTTTTTIKTLINQ